MKPLDLRALPPTEARRRERANPDRHVYVNDMEYGPVEEVDPQRKLYGRRPVGFAPGTRLADG